MELGFTSIVLTGGAATRMRPLSLGCSKSMLPFFGKPLLARIFDGLAAAGLTRVVLTEKGRDRDIETYFEDGVRHGLELHYLAPAWKGTAGVVLSLLESPVVTSPAVVIYGDSLLEMDYSALIKFHREKAAVMTIACHSPHFAAFLFEDGSAGRPRTNFGVADVQADGRVTRFEEKPFVDAIKANFRNPVASAAVYVLDLDILRKVNVPNSKMLDFAFDVIPHLVAKGERVFGLAIAPGFRVDLGTLHHYLSFHLAVLRGQVPNDVVQRIMRSADCFRTSDGVWMKGTAKLHPRATIVAPSFVDVDARIGDGAHVSTSVIGKNSTICNGARVSDSVILSDVTVGAEAILNGCILGPNSSVAAGSVIPSGTVISAWSRIGGPNLSLAVEDIQALLS